MGQEDWPQGRTDIFPPKGVLRGGSYMWLSNATFAQVPSSKAASLCEREDVLDSAAM